MFSPGQLENIPEHSAAMEPPPVDRNPDTEALFAAELARLSMQERDEMLQDIHGVSDVQKEDPAFVQRCFDDLDEAMALIPVMDKLAYLQAKDLDESYTCNEDFLLMFLRANSFNIKSSASRIVSFFETKLTLFGPERLAKDITYDDLDEDDMQCLESGYAQILSGRDRAGRAIFCLLPMIRRYRTLRNRLRAAYLVVMHALRDIETQRNGMVGLAYNVGAGYTQDREAVWRMAKLVGDLPTKFKGVHYCYDNENVKMLFALAMFVWERQTRIRCRIHCGSDMECVYNLMTFGIPAEVLPITPSGDFKLEMHQEYCRRLRKFAEVRDNVKRVIIPGIHDVLLGRGKPLQKHAGNLRYHHIIESYHSVYEKAQKLEKTNLSKLIVQKMKDGGGRFLKQDDVGWIEIDDEAARYKVSHTFRNHRIAARVSEKKKNGTADHRRKHEEGSDASSSGDANYSEVEADHMSLDVQKRRRLSDVASTMTESRT